MVHEDVVALVTRRAAEGRTGTDHRKLGLAVEGGGMRGIVSGGMLLALKDFGLLGAFDAFYGTSSGAMNLAYLIGGTGWDGMAVYYDHLTHGFVRGTDAWRPGRPIVDMDYAFGQVMSQHVPIGWDTVRGFDRPAVTVLTNVDAVRSELHDMRTLGSRPIDYMRAGSWMPVVAGAPPVVDGVRYLDGGLLCPDPVYAALDDGCTDVLLLNTSPQGSWPAVPRSRVLLRPLLNHWQPGLGDAYVACRRRWDADRDGARFDADVVMDGARVRRAAAAAGSHQVEQLTLRRGRLLDGARAGYQCISRLFGRGDHAYFTLQLD